MNRFSNLTTLRVTLSAILFLGLGVLFWREGLLVFSPGDLSSLTQPGVILGGFASHQEFERACSRCHRPLSISQGELCLSCHVNIAREIDHPDRLHGKLADVANCASCHPDHQGSGFNPTGAALMAFDHSLTSFSLISHQVGYDTRPMGCNACHEESSRQPSVVECATCHAEHANSWMVLHVQEFGKECLDCHDGKDRMTGIDHNATAFPLEGGHSGIACALCHGSSDFASTPKDCAACHEEPRLHAGDYAQDCATCHNQVAWSPAKVEETWFSHRLDTRFDLALHRLGYDDQPLTCRTCHPDSENAFVQSTCLTCHRQEDRKSMRGHVQEVGRGCLQCHNGVDRMRGFDHAAVFRLVGQHEGQECIACHQEYNFTETPGDCVGCHAEPELHQGEFGMQCHYCHDAQAWSPARLQYHVFPIQHGEEGDLDCETCHVPDYRTYTCYGCHDHQAEAIEESHFKAGIAISALENCQSCHPDGLIPPESL